MLDCLVRIIYNEASMKRLKQLRKTHKLTQKELGDKVGVQDSAISKYERGEVLPPSDILIKLSDVFDCTTDYLLGRTERPSDVFWTDLPPQLRDAGIDAVEIAKEALEAGLTKEDIKRMIELFKDWSKK